MEWGRAVVGRREIDEKCVHCVRVYYRWLGKAIHKPPFFFFLTKIGRSKMEERHDSIIPQNSAVGSQTCFQTRTGPHSQKTTGTGRQSGSQRCLPPGRWMRMLPVLQLLGGSLNRFIKKQQFQNYQGVVSEWTSQVCRIIIIRVHLVRNKLSASCLGQNTIKS